MEDKREGGKAFIRTILQQYRYVLREPGNGASNKEVEAESGAVSRERIITLIRLFVPYTATERRISKRPTILQTAVIPQATRLGLGTSSSLWVQVYIGTNYSITYPLLPLFRLCII